MLSLTPFLTCLFAQAVFADLLSTDQCTGSTKQCLIRTDLINAKLWNYYAGFWCYYFSSALISKYNVATVPVNCNGTLVGVYALIIDPKGTKLLIDYENETSMSYIKPQFSSEGYELFLRCNRDSVDCCQNQMNEDNILSSKSHCPTIWDSWTCFPQTEVYTTAKKPCSSQYYGLHQGVCTLESQKTCLWNNESQEAEWVQQTNYDTCSLSPVYSRRYQFHIISLSVCIIFCFPAIIVFLIFRKLRSTVRVILHRNLLIAICVRCVLTILSKELLYLDALRPLSESHSRIEGNSVGCRVLTFLESSSINSIYGCMLLDAFYLHKVIVRVFAKEMKIVYIYSVLVGLTFTFSVCWAISLASKDIQNCWLESTNFQWIMDGFRVAILFINTLLLADIIRVMIFKLKHKSTTELIMEGDTYKKIRAAFRATIFLIPLFGLHILITAKRIVYDNSCLSEDLYNYARYTMEGLQGIIVSIIFCYANNEVQLELKNSCRKIFIFMNQKFDCNLRINSSNRRRGTTATYVQETYN